MRWDRWMRLMVAGMGPRTLMSSFFGRRSRRCGLHRLAGGREPVEGFVAEVDDRHPPVRGQAAFLAVVQLGFNEALEVVLEGELDGGLIGQEGLDDDHAGFFGSAGPACDLADELKGPLVGPKIRHGKAGVGADDAHERDIGEMQALGEHLGAGQDVDFAGGEVVEHPVVIVGGAPSIASLSTRITRAAGILLCSSSSSRWEPMPSRTIRLPHSGQACGTSVLDRQ